MQWLAPRIGPSRWRVVLSVPGASRLLVDAEGATEFATSTIYLLATLPPERLPDVLVHELLHACAYVQGASQVLAWSESAEESAVTLLSPALAGTLLDLGLLALPPLPPLPPVSPP